MSDVAAFIVFVSAVLLLAVPAEAGGNADLFTVSGPLMVFHVFTGPDASSHVDTITLEGAKGVLAV